MKCSKKYLLFLLAVISLSCFVYVDRALAQELIEEYASGRVVLTVNKFGVFKKMSSNVEEPNAVFSSEKDSIEFYVGDTVVLEVRNVDFSRYTFMTRLDAEENKKIRVKLTLQPLLGSVLFLDSMCQTVYWNNPYYTPVVQVAGSLDYEQVVYTPIFNELCIMVGYEVRYGSVESSICGADAKRTIDEFSDCMASGNGRHSASKSGKRSDQRTKENKLPPRSLEEILFGIKK